MRNKKEFYSTLAIISACLFFLTPLYAPLSSDAASGNEKASEKNIAYEISFPKNMLKKLLLHSGHAFDSGENKYGSVIGDSKIVLYNRKLGKTSAAGEIQVVSDDKIKFVAKKRLRFSPDSVGTSITFGRVRDRDDDNAALIVLTGRWVNFFGYKICPGQVFNIPGESQCV